MCKSLFHVMFGISMILPWSPQQQMTSSMGTTVIIIKKKKWEPQWYSAMPIKFELQFDRYWDSSFHKITNPLALLEMGSSLHDHPLSVGPYNSLTMPRLISYKLVSWISNSLFFYRSSWCTFLASTWYSMKQTSLIQSFSHYHPFAFGLTPLSIIGCLFVLFKRQFSWHLSLPFSHSLFSPVLKLANVFLVWLCA